MKHCIQISVTVMAQYKQATYVHVYTWIHCSCGKVDLLYMYIHTHTHTCIYMYMYTTTIRVVSWPAVPTRIYLYISYSLHCMLCTVNCMPSNVHALQFCTMYVYIHVHVLIERAHVVHLCLECTSITDCAPVIIWEFPLSLKPRPLCEASTHCS